MYVSKSHHLCICVFKDSDDDFVEIMMFGAGNSDVWKVGPGTPS